MSLERAASLFGATGRIATIAPPGRSLDDWERFLRECEAAGIVASVGDDGKTREAGPLSFSLLRRWRWLRHARQENLSYDQAELLFRHAVEIDREQQRKRQEEIDRNRAREVARAGRKRGWGAEL